MRNSQGEADAVRDECLHSGSCFRKHSSVLKLLSRVGEMKGRGEREGEGAAEYWLKALETIKRIWEADPQL